VLTDAEAKAMEGGNAARMKAANAATKDGTKVDELPSCGGGQTGPACGYNAFWVDPWHQGDPHRLEARTSIIVEPKDGKLPLNAAAQGRIRAAQGNARVGNFDGPSAGRWASAAWSASARPPARRCCRCSTTTTTRSCRTPTR
jgi:hypothetical protein